MENNGFYQVPRDFNKALLNAKVRINVAGKYIYKSVQELIDYFVENECREIAEECDF